MISTSKPNGYQAIVDVVRRQIVSGQLALNDRLPPIREAAKLYGVNYNTISRVVRELQQSGYVRTDGRQGTVVSDVWQSSPTYSGVAVANARLRPLRIGMVATRHVYDPAWTRPLHLVLERLLTATVFQAGGTLHQFVWTAPSSADSLVEEIVKMPLDGLVLPSDPIQGAPDLPGRLRDAGVFCVGFSGGAMGWTCDIDSVKIDDEWAFREITQRLIALGHRRIAFVGHSLDAPYTSAWTHARLEAWRGVMAKAGLACGEEDVFLSEAATDDPNNMASEPVGGWPEGVELVRQETYGCAAALRFNPNRHTAAVCANDHAAVGFIKGLRGRGIRVPEDVSVTGYDNHPEDFVRRELTTFALPEQKIVDSFLRIVAGRVSGEKPEDVQTTETLRPILVSRSSWAKQMEI